MNQFRPSQTTRAIGEEYPDTRAPNTSNVLRVPRLVELRNQISAQCEEIEALTGLLNDTRQSLGLNARPTVATGQTSNGGPKEAREGQIDGLEDVVDTLGYGIARLRDEVNMLRDTL